MASLTSVEQELLKRDGFVVTQQRFRQCFQPYLREQEMARFITADSILNGFHVLLEESVKAIEEVCAQRLRRALLAVWGNLRQGPPEALVRAGILVGVALRLLDEPLELGPQVEAEVERVREATGFHFPEWLESPTPGFQGMDYARYRVRGFYTSSLSLQRYFQAVSWLHSIPLRVELEVDLQTAWLLAQAQDFATLDPVRSCWSGLAAPSDWDLSLFSGRESWEEFREKVASLPPPPALNDQMAYSASPSIRFLSARALPDSLFFWQRDPQSLPDPQALCAALGSRLARKNLKGPVGGLEVNPEHLFSSYLEVLRHLLQPPDPAAPPFMHGEPWERKSCQTVLAGWALMRHTWALQAKDVVKFLCLRGFPRPVGFVEPVPQFFRALAGLSERFQALLGQLGALEPNLSEWIEPLRSLALQAQVEADSAKSLENKSGLLHKSKKCLQFAEEIETGRQPDLWLVRYYLKRPDLGERWHEFPQLCRELARLAEQQLSGTPASEQDNEFILGYGKRLAELMFYEGDASDRPQDDAPRICQIGVDLFSGNRLHVGVSQPRAIYVNYPTPKGNILCRGAVLSYAQILADHPLTDEEWRQQLRNRIPPVPDWLARV